MADPTRDGDAATLDWTAELLDQLTWHWEHQLRRRLDGLTDDEYFWKPVPDAWSIAPAGASNAPITAGSGTFLVDFAMPEPDPAPVTTIAWRLAHLLVGVLGARNARHFGAAPVDYDSYDYPGTSDEALARFDAAYTTWRDGVASLDATALARPCGEHGFEDRTMAALVLHIHRELIHHGAEIALLRDLYLRARAG